MPSTFLSGVDAALDGVAPFAGHAYFFKGDQYVRYNWKTGLVDLDPRPIKRNWREPRGLTIWAYTPDVSLKVCEDARLGGKDNLLAYPTGDLTGQAGWDMGLPDYAPNPAHCRSRLTTRPLES